MSSESSTSSIRQFGLYKTIDARTEEFLRLSRKRQLRQGCICAAISTAITVVVVIVVLLIYEYLIVVESNSVQNIQSKYKVMHDQPIADRLDRSYFGFDQDYFEKMPLLVNALQENNYVETTSENISSLQNKKQRFHDKPELPHTIYKSIRRTTPRPFIYEYRSPNPSPFTKNFNSRSWIDSYRNAQRLKNLNQVIQYLEKTLNAKFGDIYEPSTAQIAFSGVYVAPINTRKKQLKPNENCREPQTSKPLKHQINHVSDPLFVYKPENPGDINLLADGYRFSPMFKANIQNQNKYTPMMRPLMTNKRKCIGYSCDYLSRTQGSDSFDVKETPPATSNKPQAFGVMLNLYPVHTNIDEIIDIKSTSPTNKIYFTTVRPSYQFKKKSNHNMSIRRNTFKPKFPKVIDENRFSDIATTQATSRVETTTAPQLVVRFNVYSMRKNPTLNSKHDDFYETTTSMSTNTTDTNHKYNFQLPNINSSNVEDYHAGSSGIIPVQDRTPLPTYLPTVPQFGEQYLATESITTNPDIIKFSPEDAKIPDEYLNYSMRKSDITFLNESDLDEKRDEVNIQPELKLDHGSAALNRKDVEPKPLVIKLKNIAKTTTETPTTETVDYSEENSEVYSTTTTEPGDTYVPMINGHYRSSKRKSLNTLFHENSEKYRKKRLESSITYRSTYVPMYVEINRKRTNASVEND